MPTVRESYEPGCPEENRVSPEFSMLNQCMALRSSLSFILMPKFSPRCTFHGDGGSVGGLKAIS